MVENMNRSGSSDSKEHDIGSGSSGGGEHKGEEMSTMPSQVTEAIPSGLGEMIPFLVISQFQAPCRRQLDQQEWRRSIIFLFSITLLLT